MDDVETEELLEWSLLFRVTVNTYLSLCFI